MEPMGPEGKVSLRTGRTPRFFSSFRRIHAEPQYLGTTVPAWHVCRTRTTRPARSPWDSSVRRGRHGRSSGADPWLRCHARSARRRNADHVSLHASERKVRDAPSAAARCPSPSGLCQSGDSGGGRRVPPLAAAIWFSASWAKSQRRRSTSSSASFRSSLTRASTRKRCWPAWRPPRRCDSGAGPRAARRAPCRARTPGAPGCVR